MEAKCGDYVRPKTKTNYVLTILLYIQCTVVIFFAYFREIIQKIGFKEAKLRKDEEDASLKGFQPLYNDFVSVYSRNIYGSFKDEIVNKSVTTAPDRIIKICHRRPTDGTELTEHVDDVVNFGSYNYLGFSQNSGPCAEESAKMINKFGIGSCSSRHELGNVVICKQLEQTLAKFLGVEDSVCFAMGFTTNMSNIGCLVGPNSLILSDQYNHSSIVVGCRLTNLATIEIFNHNDMEDLEKRLIKAIIRGKNGKPYDKILVCVEGIYSMEGTIVPLPKILALKRLYKFYLYLDEAHSIGALGKNGRGICQYFGIDPNEVDLLMGTFTKGFGSVGGYMAGKKRLIDYLRIQSPACCYGCPLSAACVQQVISSINALNGEQGHRPSGRDRVKALANNTKYFHSRLRDFQIPVYGHEDSPVVTVPLHFMTKIIFAYRAMLSAGIGTVVVGFPATSITSTRIRFCLSALHTKQDLDKAVHVLHSLNDLICVSV